MELADRAGFGRTTMTKLSKGRNVETDVIVKICAFLHVQPADIMEYVEVKEKVHDKQREN